MLKLHTDTAWLRIRDLARRANGHSLVAVSFLASGAFERLPLKRGDVLVVRFDAAAVRGGVVDPREILRYLRRGVEVHAVANLHAKVYVFGGTAVVGSANVSTLSENSLVEAISESNDRSFVSACRRFVLSLRGDVVDPHFAKSLVPLYRPPRVVAPIPRHRSPIQSPLSVVVLSPTDFDEYDERALAESRMTAAKRLADTDVFRIEFFRWPGTPPKALRRGTNILCCTHYSKRNVTVAAPARVLYVRTYASRNGKRTLMYTAVRKRSRERALHSLVRQVPDAAFIKRVRAFRPVTNRVLARKLTSAWPESRSAG